MQPGEILASILSTVQTRQGEKAEEATMTATSAYRSDKQRKCLSQHVYECDHCPTIAPRHSAQHVQSRHSCLDTTVRSSVPVYPNTLVMAANTMRIGSHFIPTSTTLILRTAHSQIKPSSTSSSFRSLPAEETLLPISQSIDIIAVHPFPFASKPTRCRRTPHRDVSPCTRSIPDRFAICFDYLPAYRFAMARTVRRSIGSVTGTTVLLVLCASLDTEVW